MLWPPRTAPPMNSYVFSPNFPRSSLERNDVTNLKSSVAALRRVPTTPMFFRWTTDTALPTKCNPENGISFALEDHLEKGAHLFLEMTFAGAMMSPPPCGAFRQLLCFSNERPVGDLQPNGITILKFKKIGRFENFRRPKDFEFLKDQKS